MKRLFLLVLLANLARFSLAGEHFNIFEGKKMVALRAGDTTALHKLSTGGGGVGIARNLCVGRCSASVLCNSVQYDLTSQSCDLFDAYAGDDVSNVLGLTGDVGFVVYSKIPAAKPSANKYDAVASLNKTIVGSSDPTKICLYEAELGIANYEIAASAFSSQGGCAVATQQPWMARLNAANGFAWVACHSTNWLQVDLGYPKWLTKVATSGGDPGAFWVSSYKLQFSVDPTGVYWKTFKSAAGDDVVSFR